MHKKVRLLPALAVAMALVPVAEAAAIVVAARHDLAMSAISVQHQSLTAQTSFTAQTALVQDPFSMGHVTRAGYELIMVSSTPVLTSIH